MGKPRLRAWVTRRRLLLAAAGLTLIIGPGCVPRSKRDPDQSQVLYELGAKYYAGRRVEAAIAELQKALKADPENADAYNMLGIIALRQGADYLTQLETASCLKGRDAEVVREDALQKFREAEANFKKAVELRAEFSNAWNNLSVASFHLEDWDGSIAAARNALKDPTYSEPQMARANLGWAYFYKKDLLNAWKELHEAVSQGPGFCVGQYRLAKVYVERGEIDSAADEVDAVIANEKCPIQEAYLLGGLVHERRKDRDRARALFERCASLAPRSCMASACTRYAQLIQ
jgi:type IV pilus assembly protein PilF